MIIPPWVNTIGAASKFIFEQIQNDVYDGDYNDMFAPLTFSGLLPVCVTRSPPNNFRRIVGSFA